MNWITKTLCCGLLIFSLFGGGVLGAQLSIPAGRLPGGVNWTSNQVGVVGGIPNVTTIYTNISPSGNAGTDWTNIQYALLYCPANQVVYLNEGTFTLARDLNFGVGGSYGWTSPNNFKNGVVLRGAGMGKTILNLAGSHIQISGYGVSGYALPNFPTTKQAYLWTSGYSQGTTNITIGANTGTGAPVSGLAVGSMILLTQENDTNLVNVTGVVGGQHIYTDAWGKECNQIQWVTVTGISNGTNLTIWPAVYMTNYRSALKPQILWTGYNGLASLCGIENLSIEATNTGNQSAIQLIYAYNCWVQNVEVAHPWYSGVSLNWSAHCTVQGCYIHDCATGGTDQSYGFYAASASDCVFQNNICNRITSPVLFQAGTSGCVFGYNYATNFLYKVSPGWQAFAINVHGAHPTMNLFEGNVCDSVNFDVVHGSSSHNMVFRNYLHGYDLGGLQIYSGEPGYSVNNTVCFSAETWNRWQAAVGNVMGTLGYTMNYEVTPLIGGSWTRLIYRLGYFGGMGTDNEVVNTLWRNGNYDYATASTIWDTNGVQTLPASLYLASQPSWWIGGVPWPPIGSELTPRVSAIPAQRRFATVGVRPAVPTNLKVLGTGQ